MQTSLVADSNKMYKADLKQSKVWLMEAKTFPRNPQAGQGKQPLDGWAGPGRRAPVASRLQPRPL